MLFYVFILTQTLEHWLLSLFVTIQNSVTLAELDIVKQLYMEQEAKLYKFFKLRIYVVAFLQTGIGILPFFAGVDLKYIVIAQMSTFIATLVLVTQEYFFGAMTFIISMYRLHRFEFARHVSRFTVLTVAILLSLLSSLFGFYFITVITSCLVTQTNMGNEQKVDLCFSIFSIEMSANLAAEFYFWFIVFEVLPFIFFFSLKQPHDCFRCLGKDPIRRFSMFQLTREETRNREFSVKYGRGGFRLNGTIATAANSGTQNDIDESPHSVS